MSDEEGPWFVIQLLIVFSIIGPYRAGTGAEECVDSTAPLSGPEGRGSGQRGVDDQGERDRDGRSGQTRESEGEQNKQEQERETVRALP